MQIGGLVRNFCFHLFFSSSFFIIIHLCFPFIGHYKIYTFKRVLCFCYSQGQVKISRKSRKSRVHGQVTLPRAVGTGQAHYHTVVCGFHMVSHVLFVAIFRISLHLMHFGGSAWFSKEILKGYGMPWAPEKPANQPHQQIMNVECSLAAPQSLPKCIKTRISKHIHEYGDVLVARVRGSHVQSKAC